jgi:hypothetical protein
MLRDGGASEPDIEQMMVANPRRILAPADPTGERAGS